MTTKRDDRVVRALRQAASAGSLSASFILGRLYDEGWGVKKDAKSAVRWYRIAAAGGFAEAYYFVGSSYAFGHGVRQDPRAAYRWFTRAGMSGDLEGAYMHAMCTFEGIGVRRDAKRGLKLLLAAARRGSRDAMDYLAAHYAKLGRLQLARRWAQRAIDAGDEVAPLRLASMARGRTPL